MPPMVYLLHARPTVKLPSKTGQSQQAAHIRNASKSVWTQAGHQCSFTMTILHVERGTEQDKTADDSSAGIFIKLGSRCRSQMPSCVWPIVCIGNSCAAMQHLASSLAAFRCGSWRRDLLSARQHMESMHQGSPCQQHGRPGRYVCNSNFWRDWYVMFPNATIPRQQQQQQQHQQERIAAAAAAAPDRHDALHSCCTHGQASFPSLNCNPLQIICCRNNQISRC